MKNMIPILSMFFLFTGCNNEIQTEPQETSIYGTWQLVEVYSDIGDGNGSWNEIENGYTYLIKTDNSFISTKYNDCSSGKIEVNNILETLSFIFDCKSFYPCEENSATCKEYFVLDRNSLILSPTYRNCDEGCALKFKKKS